MTITGELRPPQIRSSHLHKRAIVYARQSTPRQVREHTGSTADQLKLADVARHWGWSEARIEVIDDDLGLSGTSAHNRTGLQRVFEEMDRGEIGLLLVRDVSRISRNPHDAEIFLTKLIDNGVLLYANGQLFDGATEDLAQLFGLRVHNLLAWWENQNRTRTMRSAKMAKARQGHAVTHPPLGYVRAPVKGKWIKDPDPRIQEAVRLIFDLCRKTGSVGNVIRHMRRHHMLFPRRRGPEVSWLPPSRSQVHALLTNPAYTGDYVFRRTQRTPSAKAWSGNRKMLRPETDWVTVPTHHEPYVSRDEWQTIQAALASRRPRVRPPVGRGWALLQGLIQCAPCNRFMYTRYQAHTRPGRSASYSCSYQDREDVWHFHLSCGTNLLDAYIVRRVLDALQPVQLQAALDAIEEHRIEQTVIAKAQNRQLQHAKDEVETARRRYTLANPNHRLVKADLEAQLEQALAKFDALKREMAAATPPPPIVLKAENARDLIALGERVETLWNAPTTTNLDRKRLLRLVISRILVLEKTDDFLELEIVWASGLQERCRLLLSAGVAARAYALALGGKTSAEIAAELRADGVLTIYGQPPSRYAVALKLRRRGITAKAKRHDTLVQIRALLMEGRQRREILDILNRDLPPSRRWSLKRLSKAVSKLRRGDVPDVPPLPPVLPEARERDALLQFITQRRQVGDTYAAIARELNASGRRPQFATSFRDTQVANLLRSRRAQALMRGDKHKGPRK